MKNAMEIFKALEAGKKIRHKNKKGLIFTSIRDILDEWSYTIAEKPEYFEIVKPKVKMYAHEVQDHQIPGSRVMLWHKDERAIEDFYHVTMIGNKIPFLRVPSMDYERDMTPDEGLEKKKGILY